MCVGGGRGRGDVYLTDTGFLVANFQKHQYGFLKECISWKKGEADEEK